MNQQTQVCRDLAEFRAELRGSALAPQTWLQCRTLRCVIDIGFDLSVIALAIAACASPAAGSCSRLICFV